MVNFPWEWEEFPLEERLICFFVWVRKENPSLNLEEILKEAKQRVDMGKIKINEEGRNGCYNGGKCFSVYASCVILPNTGHSVDSRREYYVAALAAFIKKNAFSSEEANKVLDISSSEDRKIEWRVGGREYLSDV